MREMIAVMVSLFLLAGLLLGCALIRRIVPGNECEPESLRCNAGNTEICGTDSRWRVEKYCHERGEGITCQMIDGKTYCKEVAK